MCDLLRLHGLLGRVSVHLVIAMFAIWVVATVGVQLPRLRPWLQARSFSILIPEYRFFAPNPAEGDFHLLFRDIYKDGTTTVWTELCLLKPRRLSHAIWNPEKRPRKALFDCVAQLGASMNHLGSNNPNALKITTPYLLMLNHVSSMHRTVPGIRTQFIIMQTHGWASEQPASALFTSAPHILKRATVTRCVAPIRSFASRKRPDKEGLHSLDRPGYWAD
jgi:hypothetical protein